MDGQGYGEGDNDPAGGSVHEHEDADWRCWPMLTPELCGVLAEGGRQNARMRARAADGTWHTGSRRGMEQNQGTWRHLEPPQLIACTIP